MRSPVIEPNKDERKLKVNRTVVRVPRVQERIRDILESPRTDSELMFGGDLQSFIKRVEEALYALAEEIDKRNARRLTRRP